MSGRSSRCLHAFLAPARLVCTGMRMFGQGCALDETSGQSQLGAARHGVQARSGTVDWRCSKSIASCDVACGMRWDVAKAQASQNGFRGRVAVWHQVSWCGGFAPDGVDVSATPSCESRESRGSGCQDLSSNRAERRERLRYLDHQCSGTACTSCRSSRGLRAWVEFWSIAKSCQQFRARNCDVPCSAGCCVTILSVDHLQKPGSGLKTCPRSHTTPIHKSGHASMK